MSYNEIVNLNVGGTKFVTSRTTLMREPASLLGRMFDLDSPLKPAAMQDDAYFLDRDPEKFKIILNYLREDELAVLTKTELCNLKIEARYFQLTNLLTEIDSRLDEMEVYKFRSGDACVVVKKSYFRKVPLSAIVNVMCRNVHIDLAFPNLTDPVKDFIDNEIIDLEIPRDDDLSNYISSVRHHLVLYDEYVQVKATHIKINFDGHVFLVKLSAALKDKYSVFHKCWYNEHNDHDQICDTLYLDEEGNYSPRYTMMSGIYDKEIITTSLLKLETCSITVYNKTSEMTEFDFILYEMGFLAYKSKLVDA